MPQGGFLEQKPRSPGSLAIVIALHAAAITALALSKMEMPKAEDLGPLIIKDIPVDPDPPPVPVQKPADPKTAKQKTAVTIVPPRVTTPRNDPIVFSDPGPVDPPVFTSLPPGPTTFPLPVPLPPPPAPKAEVRKEAQIDPRAELQPPYPSSEERAGKEGSVTLRVLIGPDGRVKAAERLRAASEAFWRATERHALRNWRFRPATLGGKPVESSKVMTVHFELRG
ncbi:MAG TPA: TonB family protein [Allosphingosinicella sp.]|jgi:protein TonB